MRVADKMAFTQVNQNLAKNRSDLSNLQNQAATQKRVLKPSDDPLASTRVLSLKTETKNAEQFAKNSGLAKSFLEFTDQSLSELTETLVRAKELAVGQANDATANESSRRVVASEIEQLFWQTVQLSNRKLGDRYIFGGYNTTQTPFNGAGEYTGDSGDIKVQVNKDTFIAMNLPGNKVFLGEGISQDGIVRSKYEAARTVEELEKQQIQEQQDLEKQQEDNVILRGPAATNMYSASWDNSGINLFGVLRKLEIGLRTNDKQEVQESLDKIDQAISQVVLARSQIGSRVTTIDSNLESLQKAKMDSKVEASQLEDADAFAVMSDISKADSTLQATLNTSGKLIQRSLLDFLR